MSYKIQKQVGVSTWFNGVEQMPAPQPVVVTQAVFENDEGQKLRLQVSGAEDQVRQYLESMSFAFRAKPVADLEELEAELSRLEVGENTIPPGETVPVAVAISFDFIDLAPPYQWEVWFDPRYDVQISGADAPHCYTTTAAKFVKATVYADGGTLKMMLWQGVVTVGNQQREGVLMAYWQNPTKFSISVKGLDASNQYDLYVYGATI